MIINPCLFIYLTDVYGWGHVPGAVADTEMMVSPALMAV